MLSERPIYLGQRSVDGWPSDYWSDGTTLPVLSGRDDADDDASEDDDLGDESTDDLDADEADDDEHDDDYNLKNRVHSLSRESAKHRIQRNKAYLEIAELRAELEFTRAAAGTFVDVEAAWKLADRRGITIDKNGTVSGVDDVIDALVEKHPFMVVESQDEPQTERNPFAARKTRTGTKRKLNPQGLDRATLEKKYPALKQGR